MYLLGPSNNKPTPTKQHFNTKRLLNQRVLNYLVIANLPGSLVLSPFFQKVFLGPSAAAIRFSIKTREKSKESKVKIVAPPIFHRGAKYKEKLQPIPGCSHSSELYCGTMLSKKQVRSRPLANSETSFTWSPSVHPPTPLTLTTPSSSLFARLLKAMKQETPGELHGCRFGVVVMLYYIFVRSI